MCMNHTRIEYAVHTEFIIYTVKQYGVQAAMIVVQRSAADVAESMQTHHADFYS